MITIDYVERGNDGLSTKVGHVIRSERIRQDMKQIVLAKGICTPSYLSKIERNLIHPSDDVAELLLKRLGVDAKKFHESTHKNNDKEFMDLLLESYRNVITRKDKTYAKEQLDMLMEKNPLSYDDSVYYTYLLVTLRFRLIVGGELEERKKELDALDALTPYLDEFQLYLLNINRGLFYYVTRVFVKSIECFEAAYPSLENLLLDDWEVAEFHYIAGVAYAADSRTLHSIENVRKALAYFSKKFLMRRVVDCYILMGVIQKQSGNYDEALESYLKAREISEEFNLQINHSIVLHNIGSLYSITGESEQAVDYYKKSLVVKEEVQGDELISYYCIAMEYSKMKESSLVIEWCERGLDCYRRLDDENQESYYHQFVFLKSMHSEKGLCEKVAKNTIGFFKDTQEYQTVSKYCIALGDWYFENKKYKLAALLYQESHKYGNLYKNITEWEDL